MICGCTGSGVDRRCDVLILEERADQQSRCHEDMLQVLEEDTRQWVTIGQVLCQSDSIEQMLIVFDAKDIDWAGKRVTYVPECGGSYTWTLRPLEQSN